ncbi:MAG: LCP family protein [Halothermotrichaceae bacterium]
MRKLSKKAIYSTLVIIVLIIGFIVFFFFNNDFWALRNNPFKSSKLNILVLGYDSTVNGPPRADTIMVASIDLDTKQVGLLSIPRDTRMKIPGHDINRVNASHAFGGVELTEETLELFLDIPIDYYIETDFQGFAKIVDSIGGVELAIEESLNYTDEAGDLYINLPAGRQKLDGQEALQYVRYRGVHGDIGRVERQQKFLKAMIKKVLSPDIIVKLPSIYQETTKAVKTNIPISDVTPFIRLVKEIDLNKVQMVMLSGEAEYINGASYWIVDEKEAEILVNKLVRSKEYIKNSQYKLDILNGKGETGLAGKVSDVMTKYGFDINRVGDADNYNYQETIIKYYNKKDKSLAESIKKLVGGKINYINSEDSEINEKIIQIIIGKDYKIEDQ